jgi:hypothetical protein
MKEKTRKNVKENKKKWKSFKRKLQPLNISKEDPSHRLRVSDKQLSKKKVQCYNVAEIKN